MGVRRVSAKLLAVTQNHPRGVTIAILAGWGVQLGATLLGWLPSPWTLLVDAPNATPSVSIYLGLATVSSLVAGSAGLVITLGLAARGDELRVFRRTTGPVLRRTWTSILSSAFVAAGLGLTAALLAGIQAGAYSPWLFELGILLLAHSAVRMVWLLRAMMLVIRAEDHSAAQRTDVLSLADVLSKRSA